MCIRYGCSVLWLFWWLPLKISFPLSYIFETHATLWGAKHFFTSFLPFGSPSWRQKLFRTTHGIPTFPEDVQVSRGDGVAAWGWCSGGGHAVAAVRVRGGAAHAAAFHGRPIRRLVRFGWPRWRDVWNSLQLGSLRQRSLWESSRDLVSTSGCGGNVIANGDVPHLRVQRRRWRGVENMLLSFGVSPRWRRCLGQNVLGVTPRQVVEAGVCQRQRGAGRRGIVDALLREEAIHSVLAPRRSRVFVGGQVIVAVCFWRAGFCRVSMRSTCEIARLERWWTRSGKQILQIINTTFIV